jgi:flagellar hook-basal body complex protein FliE
MMGPGQVEGVGFSLPGLEPAGPATAEGSFESSLMQAIHTVDRQQHAGDDALALLARGEHVDLHGAMIELEKADIALRAMVSVRDKLVSAYEQVMTMAI